ncbi:MAG: HD domain-containing phosphohydrolase [Longimicrobiaceae bacterium]
MFNARILVVSDRPDVVFELDAILGGGEHLSLAVPDGREALQTLEDGLVPDLVISDLGSPRSLQEIEYVWRFRELNRVGRHLAVVESGAPFSGFVRAGGGHGDEWSVMPAALPHPFRPAEVRARVDAAIDRVDADLRAMRGEMWRELHRMQRAMREMQRDTVKALAATVAARDPFMQGHATRVAELCRRVGAELCLGEDQVGLLETAALLHEIGKVSVPLELLHKTGPLSPGELERIRAHAKVGADIVRGVPALTRAAPLIEHQGTDYADLSARLDPAAPELMLAGILRVVDAWDAMVSARSYRGAMPPEYGEATLRAGAGTRFHPGAVEAVLRLTLPAPRPPARTP